MLKTIAELMTEARKNLQCINAHEGLLMATRLNAVIIDVREPHEYMQKAAVNTINIPRGLLEMGVLERFKDSEQPLFVHCASGIRATLAGEQLKRLGYKNVWVITCTLDEICQAHR